jgi:hypothetical protein
MKEWPPVGAGSKRIEWPPVGAGSNSVEGPG